MVQSIPLRAPLCCMKTFFHELRPRTQFRRTLVTLQIGKLEKIPVPIDLPSHFWPQLPKKLRPDQGKRKIIVHAPLPSPLDVCKDPVAVVDNSQRAQLDPAGARARLFDPENKEGAKVGDILLTTFKTGEPFSGVILSIKKGGIHTSVLLRNHLTRIGTEMSIKVFSPLVKSMEVAQKTPKRKRRARLYYMRKPEHDIGSVQKIVDQYLKQRAILTGGKLGSQYGVRRAAKQKRK